MKLIFFIQKLIQDLILMIWSSGKKLWGIDWEFERGGLNALLPQAWT